MTHGPRLVLDDLETPIGTLALVADEEGRLLAVGWTDGHARMERQLQRFSRPEVQRPRAREARPSLVRRSDPNGLTTALRAYFGGDLRAIDDLPVASWGTEFQRAVWIALRGIPCGETCSYADLARRIGRPSAVRAVGLANGANPIAIVVPCHRVIGSTGELTGYGGGIDRKRWLLAHEGGRAVHERATEPLGNLTVP